VKLRLKINEKNKEFIFNFYDGFSTLIPLPILSMVSPAARDKYPVWRRKHKNA